MKRVNIITRLRLLRIANKAISKLNRPKNRTKPDWHDQSFWALIEHFDIENQELKEELFCFVNLKKAVDECYDNINLPLMIADKANRQLRNERREKK